MPELPEVETTTRGLKKVLIGRVIREVWTDYNSTFHKGKDSIKDPKFFSYFKKEVEGQKVIAVERRAKNILIHLANRKTILIHMKMTGHLLYEKYEKKVFGKGNAVKETWVPVEDGPLRDPFNRFIHFVMVLDNGHHIAFSDMRKFAKITLIPTPTKGQETSQHLADIGPEPLSPQFSFDLFMVRIGRKPKAKIKPVLMDQSVIAGIGNIYADETLWRASIHPETMIEKVPQENLIALFHAIKETLRKGIDFGGDSMSDYRNIEGKRGQFQSQHQAYRKTGLPCAKPGCGGTIVKKVIAGRSSHFCNTHQAPARKKNTL